jgi:hypothetical protein
MRINDNFSKKNQKGGNNYIDQDFERCYDENLERVMNAIREYSGKHSIDHEKAREFIDRQTSPIRREAAQNLVENTIYITLEEIFIIIGELIERLYNTYNFNNIEDNIYMYTGKIDKSTYFLCVLALYHIKEKGYKKPIFVKEMTNIFFDDIRLSPLIILDDFSYSGSQLADQLNYIYHERMYVVPPPNEPPNIHILLIGLNDISKKRLSKVPSERRKVLRSGTMLNYKLSTDSPFKLLYLEDRLYRPLISILGIEKFTYMTLLFSPWIYGASGSGLGLPHVSLYLDSKIADPVSTFTTTLIYGQIPPSDVNFQYFIDNDCYPNDLIENLESDEINRLLSELPEEFKYNNKLSSQKLIKNFIKLDSENTDRRSDRITFNPFINTCSQNSIINEIIHDENISTLDYLIFMIPQECFNIKDVCSFDNELIKYYLIEKNYIIEGRGRTGKDTFTEEGLSILEYHNKITQVKCPISWYKKGPFEMVCISNNTYGGKKNRTRRLKNIKIRKYQKTRKIRKTRKTRKYKKIK